MGELSVGGRFLEGMWPRSWREWKSRLVQPFVMHAKVSRLRVDGMAGNIAVVCAPEGFPEGGAAVCHMSHEAFVPTINNERGLLSVASKPSVFSFAKQRGRINTCAWSRPRPRTST